jgi:hypothetical protein
VFSQGGGIVTKKQNRLTGDSIRMIVCPRIGVYSQTRTLKMMREATMSRIRKTSIFYVEISKVMRLIKKIPEYNWELLTNRGTT